MALIVETACIGEIIDLAKGKSCDRPSLGDAIVHLRRIFEADRLLIGELAEIAWEPRIKAPKPILAGDLDDGPKFELVRLLEIDEEGDRAVPRHEGQAERAPVAAGQDELSLDADRV